ncbi:molybdate ABC transporter substrate-binding protein [Magnetospira thiophila]
MIALLVSWPSLGRAEQVLIAVAANFTAVAQQLESDFEARSGHDAVLAFGSTGKLYVQITHGAPFEVFLAADQLRPERLEKEADAVPGSRFTYAIGKLALWSRNPSLEVGPDLLRQLRFERLALANPKTAPYGRAAHQVLEKLGVIDLPRGKIVTGENISQTLQFVSSGAADVGFVALSQIFDHTDGARWIVPDDLHDPIVQQAILLNPGRTNPAAQAFMTYLQSPDARALITRFGYGVE